MTLEVKDGQRLPIAYLPPPHIGQNGQSYGGDEHFLSALGHPPLDAFAPPHAIHHSTLKFFFDPDYVDRISTVHPRPGAGQMGAAFDPAFVEWSQRALGCSARAAEIAVTYGMGISRVGGFHHAGRSYGSDYCVYSDILYIIQQAFLKNPNQHIIVFDTDAHVANGLSKSIDEFHGRVKVFDLHNAQFSKFIPSDASQHYLPFSVDARCDDGEYLLKINEMIELMNDAVAQHPVDLIIYVAGYDVLKGDPKGLMSLTEEAVLERDRRVYETTLTLYSESRQSTPPFVWLPGGGYTSHSDAVFGKSAEWGVDRLRRAREFGELDGFSK